MTTSNYDDIVLTYPNISGGSSVKLSDFICPESIIKEGEKYGTSKIKPKYDALLSVANLSLYIANKNRLWLLIDSADKICHHFKNATYICEFDCDRNLYFYVSIPSSDTDFIYLLSIESQSNIIKIPISDILGCEIISYQANSEKIILTDTNGNEYDLKNGDYI